MVNKGLNTFSTNPKIPSEAENTLNGTPNKHRDHLRDNKVNNDKNFPYKVKFTNTLLNNVKYIVKKLLKIVDISLSLL